MYFTAYTPIFPYEVMMRMIPNFLPALPTREDKGMYVFIHSETKEKQVVISAVTTEERNVIFPPVRLFGKR